MMKCLSFIISLFILILPFAGWSQIQLEHSVPVLKIKFKSYNPTDFSYILTDNYKADQSMLTGELFFPKTGTPPFPAVILIHGSGGWKRLSFRYDLVSKLNDQGIAAFIVDSYTGRGIDRTASDQSKLTLAASLLDALEAYNALRATKKINMNHVGITGFSRGGNVAMNTIDERLQTIVLGKGNRFAAHAPVYNGCSIRWKKPKPSKSPMTFFVGEKDDYTPHEHCEDYISRLQSAGAIIKVISYPNSHHGWVTDYNLLYARNVQVFYRCRMEIDDNGVIRDTKSSASSEMGWKPFLKAMIKSGCIKRGAHVGRNKKAREQFLMDVVSFFSETLK